MKRRTARVIMTMSAPARPMRFLNSSTDTSIAICDNCYRGRIRRNKMPVTVLSFSLRLGPAGRRKGAEKGIFLVFPC